MAEHGGTAAARPEHGAAPPSEPLVLPFQALGRNDVARVGGKGANLGEMLRAGLPVPQGFVITVAAHRRALEIAGIADAVEREYDAALAGPSKKLRAAASRLRDLVLGAPLAAEVRRAVVEAYATLGHGDVPVAVRSSATAEDTPRFSFAGMLESFVNVRGEDELLGRVQACWASAYGERVLAYRRKREVVGDPFVGVVVQRMVQSEVSGVLFTASPTTGDRNRMVVESAFGLGDVVVGGLVTPDRYELDKATGSVVSRAVGHKTFKFVRDPSYGRNARVDLDEEQARSETLGDRSLAALAELGRRLEEHFGAPQDAEWAIEGGRLWLVQTRPITTLPDASEPVAEAPEGNGARPDGRPVRVVARGLGASPGRAVGRVRILRGPGGARKLKKGEILVAPTTTPDWVPVMRKAAAVVTDVGGATSHAAIVSRELGIPCIVGTHDATGTLPDGAVVGVDGSTGEVTEAPADVAAPPKARARKKKAGGTDPVTGTRLYVNLGEPSLAEAVAALPVDGVGLLRAEFMILEALGGEHPRLFLERGEAETLVDRLADALTTIAGAFHPRPVIYRAMDFRSNEFRGLKGGDRFEPDEANPMIGYRGAWRYTREPDLFEVELRALARARSGYPGLHLMLPFVRTRGELAVCMRRIDASELAGQPGLQRWIMAEVPSVLASLDAYVALGVTGVSIGSNDLTQLMLGVDRDSDTLAPLFDERDPAVLWAIERIVRACRRLGVPCSICGQAPSVYPDYVEKLVAWGIDSVSVTPDAVHRTRRSLAAAERRLLLAAARTP